MAYADLDPPTRAVAEKVLTRKQLDVFKMWMAGMSDQRIAHTLDISTSTARGHRMRAIQKMEIEKRRVAA